jgi:putative flippase GtrA
MAVLWLLIERVGLPVVLATVAATEAAVLHNFVWHLRWTWADRRTGPQAVWRRLVRFNIANGGISLVGGAMLMALLVDAIGLHYLAANLVTVLACSVANYLASDRWVFSTGGLERRLLIPSFPRMRESRPGPPPSRG